MSETPQNKIQENGKGILDDSGVRIVLAAVLALLSWVLVTMVVQPGTSSSLYNVPVDFTYDSSKYTSQGLSIVNAPEYSVNLSISGDGYVIGSLTADDFVVYPNYSSVKGSGEMTLALRAKCLSTEADNVIVTITSVVNTVKVVFDTVEEKVLPVSIKTNEISLADGYILYKSGTSPGEVTLSGPTGELEKVVSCVAEVKNEGALDATATLSTTLRFLDEEGRDVEFLYVNSDYQSADVTLTVYKLAELPVAMSFINMPENFDDSVLKYTLSEDALKVAGPENIVNALTELAVGTMDLSTFALDKDYVLPVRLPGGLVSQDNITSITVSFDCSNLSTKTLNLPADNVRVINLPSTYRLTVESERVMNVTLCGPADALEGLTADSVVALIDADDFSVALGQQNIAVRIYVPSNAQLFALGSYSVQCRIESN